MTASTSDETERHSDAQTLPPVVARYLEAADRGDIEALAACFAPDGTVVDEGVTYRGPDEILRWRKELSSTWEYTSTVTGYRPAGDGRFIVHALVEGNFPGGRADLTYSFFLDGDALSALTIVE